MKSNKLKKNSTKIILGLACAGFGWLVIKNFADLFMDFNPMTQIFIGIIGLIIIGFFVKEVKV